MSNNGRKQFMLQMYSAFWNCVSRAEDSAWKVIAAYVALFATLSLVFQTIGPAAAATIFIIFSFTAIVLALRSNVWFLRNMALISNLEKEFLDKEDYEVLVPGFFAERSKLGFLNSEIWMVQAFAYFGICLAFLFYVLPKIDANDYKIIVALVFVAGLSSAIKCGFHYYGEFKRFSVHAPGKIIEK